MRRSHGLSRKGEGFSVFVFDLDQFKAVNDTLGHPVGDALLKAVAQPPAGHGARRRHGQPARRRRIRHPAAGRHQPSAGGRHPCRAPDPPIGKPYEIEGHEIVIGISIGIALAPDDGTDATQLLKNADLALYRAKSEGRNDYPLLRGQDGCRSAAAARARNGPAQRDRARGIRAPLSEHHQCRLAADLLRRGFGALAASGTRHDPARQIHSAGRGNRR